MSLTDLIDSRRCIVDLSGVIPMTNGDAGNPLAAEDFEQQYALTEDGLLKVYSVGPVTVLGFAGQDVPSEFNVAHYRAAISDLLKLNNSSTVAFDLTGVRLVPSGMLGLLVSLTRIPNLPLTVQMFNPSADVREVLAITKLNRMIEIREVERRANRPDFMQCGEPYPSRCVTGSATLRRFRVSPVRIRVCGLAGHGFCNEFDGRRNLNVY